MELSQLTTMHLNVREVLAHGPYGMKNDPDPSYYVILRADEPVTVGQFANIVVNDHLTLWDVEVTDNGDDVEPGNFWQLVFKTSRQDDMEHGLSFPDVFRAYELRQAAPDMLPVRKLIEEIVVAVQAAYGAVDGNVRVDLVGDMLHVTGNDLDEQVPLHPFYVSRALMGPTSFSRTQTGELHVHLEYPDVDHLVNWTTNHNSELQARARDYLDVVCLALVCKPVDEHGRPQYWYITVLKNGSMSEQSVPYTHIMRFAKLGQYPKVTFERERGGYRLEVNNDELLPQEVLALEKFDGRALALTFGL